MKVSVILRGDAIADYVTQVVPRIGNLVCVRDLARNFRVTDVHWGYEHNGSSEESSGVDLQVEEEH